MIMAKPNSETSYQASQKFPLKKKPADNDDNDDFVDPRVQVELEQLNSATDAINRLEVRLDEARAAYRHLLGESSQRFKSLAAKLGNCIEKAQPYYEARLKAKEAHIETQKAALRFERAFSAHGAAKEMVFHAEEGLIKEGMTFDPTWQEMLNHATEKVNEAERERTISKAEHRIKSQKYIEAEQQVQFLQKELKRTISKSRPYYEMKAHFNQLMEEQKNQVQLLEKEILRVKQSYSVALNNLEEISIEIHQQRQQKQQRKALGSRGSGVGAESPAPPPQEMESGITDVDETYLKLPVRVGSLKTSTVYASAGSIQSPPEEGNSCTDATREVLRVDNACQTESFENSISTLSDPKSHSDRISAWVHESGLRMLAAARSASVLPGLDGVYAGNLASMLLNATEESDRSDVESLNSADVLTDDQVSNLMLDKDLEDCYPDIAYGSKNKEEFKMPEISLSQFMRKRAKSDDSSSKGEIDYKELKNDEESKSSSEDRDSGRSAKNVEISPPDSITPSQSSQCIPHSSNPKPSNAGSSELKVVALQFTVQETVVTPKLNRKAVKPMTDKDVTNKTSEA